MFFENIRFQIAAIAFFIVMLTAFLTNRKLRIRSTAVFSLLLTATGLNLCFDILTVYTITHMDTVPEWFNRLAHQLFIGTLDILLYLLFVYVLTLGKKQKLKWISWVVISLPIAISMLVVIFGDITYFNDGNIIYSYGTMPSTIYVCIGIYLLASNAIVIFKHTSFDANMRRSVLMGIIIWVVAAIVQILHPGILITGLAVSLMMVYIFISFENPREFYEKDLKCFNRGALDIMLDEVLSGNKTFYLVNITIDDFSDICYKMGTSEGREVFRQVAMYCSNTYGTNVYHNRNNTLNMIFFDDEKKVMAYAQAISARLKSAFSSITGRTYLKCRVDVLECPKYAKTTNDIHDIIDYLLIHPNKVGEDGQQIKIGDDFMENKKRYNKIEDILEDALENDGFYVVFQPIFSNTANAFSSAEALVRLKDTTTIGYISPEEFIPIAERKGCIEKLDEMVLEKVCKMFSDNDMINYGIKYIEVNLSGMQVCDTDLSERICKILKRFCVAPHCINFEITETATVESMDELKNNMGKLRKLGCSFSMDDFGTGYSNLAQIAETNYDLIKIDKSLIWPCFQQGDRNARIVLESVIKMGHLIHSQIVAEGVENLEQLQYLQQLGVQYIQGYYFSKPLKEEDFVAFIKTHFSDSKQTEA